MEKLGEWAWAIAGTLLALIWKERKAATDRLEARVSRLEEVACSREELMGRFKEVRDLIQDMRREQEANRKELMESIGRVHTRVDQTNKTILDLVRRNER